MTTSPQTTADQIPANTRDATASRLLAHANAPLWLFAATLFSSALLLFAVQPMFAKLALPKLGGSPSVWAVSLCFFQAALLAGYGYAHALNRLLTPRAAVASHLAVLVVAFLALPIGLPQQLGEPPQGDAYLWLIGVLSLGVGLPFLAVSASAPLLQSWFVRTGHPAARDPYFLYGASNLGSLLALVAYPLAIEPMLGVTTQTRLWSLGFMILALLIGICGAAVVWLSARQQTDAQDASAPTPAVADAGTSRITWKLRSLWVLLAALPSGLMVAVTTFITTDIASAPFMWVVPLALFLLTFIMVFKAQVSKHFPFLAYVLHIAAICSVIVWQGRIVCALVAFFVAALCCHRELYLRRPEAAHLTEFYLWMSFGGLIGGMFSALIAPQLFTTTAEFQWLLAASLFCVPGLIFGAPHELDHKRILGMACFAFACLAARALATDLVAPSGQYVVSALIIVGIMLALFFTRHWNEGRVVLMIGVALAMLTIPDGFRPIYAERSFFGTVRVLETNDAQHRIMVHGTTLHGKRRIKTAEGDTVAHPSPASYYHMTTPLARGFDVVRRAKSADKEARILAGIVGLGTGSLACYMKPGDSFRFFEIDPVVVKIASTPKYFDFLSTCAPKAPIVIGDARLTLAKEPDEVFDYLVLDAFSSDSVPVHLLTVEALQLYMSKLADNGLLALHISNRYMDLATSVGSTIAEIPGVQAAVVRFNPPKGFADANASQVVLISKSARMLDDVMTWADAEGLPRSTTRPWTDDYSNVLAAIARRFWN